MPTFEPTFEPSVVDAVLRHMNSDHREDNVLIARAFADASAESAEMTALDDRAGVWSYVVDGGHHELRMPWSVVITERAEIRREIVALYDSATDRLGLPPRIH